MHVIKVGGNELDVPGFMETLAAALASQPGPQLLVHGGGRAIGMMQERLGVEPKKVDGLRVTDEESLDITTMVLSGLTNKRLVAALAGAGVDAVGWSGVDGGLLRAKKKVHPTADLGYVGEVAEVRTDLLQDVLNRGATVVLAPVSLGLDGHMYNVNADEAAAAVAVAAEATELSFVTNVEGVTRDGSVIGDIDYADVEGLIQSGVAGGGMVPKLRAARQAASSGVERVRITNLAGLRGSRGTRIVGCKRCGAQRMARNDERVGSSDSVDFGDWGGWKGPTGWEDWGS